MKNKQPHITIKLNQLGESVILVDDYKLFDYINDYLCEERELEFESYLANNNGTNKMYEMNFGTKYSVEKLEMEIEKIDRNEILRIYNLNN